MRIDAAPRGYGITRIEAHLLIACHCQRQPSKAIIQQALRKLPKFTQTSLTQHLSLQSCSNKLHSIACGSSAQHSSSPLATPLTAPVCIRTRWSSSQKVTTPASGCLLQHCSAQATVQNPALGMGSAGMQAGNSPCIAPHAGGAAANTRHNQQPHTIHTCAPNMPSAVNYTHTGTQLQATHPLRPALPAAAAGINLCAALRPSST